LFIEVLPKKNEHEEESGLASASLPVHFMNRRGLAARPIATAKSMDRRRRPDGAERVVVNKVSVVGWNRPAASEGDGTLRDLPCNGQAVSLPAHMTAERNAHLDLRPEGKRVLFVLRWLTWASAFL
jgi:hypothetical protein